MSVYSEMISSRGFEYGVQHFLAARSGLIQDIVGAALSITPENVNELIWLGAVYQNHRRCVASIAGHVVSGDYLRVHTRPRRYQAELIRYPEIIIFENADFIVINKPAGVPVHPTVDNRVENILHILSKKMDVDLKKLGDK